jgi:hypothetical protein
MVEEINQVRNQSTKSMLKELCMETFLVFCSVVVHHPNGIPDVTI